MSFILPDTTFFPPQKTKTQGKNRRSFGVVLRRPLVRNLSLGLNFSVESVNNRPTDRDPKVQGEGFYLCSGGWNVRKTLYRVHFVVARRTMYFLYGPCHYNSGPQRGSEVGSVMDGKSFPAVHLYFEVE